MSRARSTDEKLTVLAYWTIRLKRKVELKGLRGTLLQSILALYAKQRTLLLESGRFREKSPEGPYPSRIDKEIDSTLKSCQNVNKELNDMLKKVNLFKQ